MSATDEELQFVKDNEMDHVTYILITFRSVHFVLVDSISSLKYIPFSNAFLLYTFIVVLINLYTTTGRNAGNAKIGPADEGGIELVTPSTQPEWYSRLPVQHNANAAALPTTHVVGEDEDDEDLMAPQHRR